MKKLLALLLLCTLLLSLSACADPVIGEAPAEAPISADSAQAPEAVIFLEGDSVSASVRSVTVSGSVVTIGAPGSYTVRGTLNDGRIIIDLKENPGKVTLFLDGADITCLTDSAIYLVQAKELNLVLAAGSENRVVSGTEADLAAYDETRQGAAVFAEDDLDIQGEGSLTVLGYLNNGITCKDDIKLKGGELSVLAANNGIRASESVTMSGGAVNIQSGNDALKASSAKKAGKGFVQIDGGELTVSAGGDGVSAETELRISGGSLTVAAAGDSSLVSCKGLKGKTGVTISGGTITVKATDDGISCADTVSITGGELLVQSGADGIQGGKKGTGFGDTVGSVIIEGGRILISAYNKPVDAKASFQISGGTLLACGRGTPSPAGEIPWLLYTAKGSAGDALSVKAGDEPGLTAAYAYSTVFFADPTLSEGQSYSLQAGSQTLEAIASR